MTYKYLLFDADDTLFDFKRAQELSLNTLFSIYKLPSEAKSIYKQISHPLWLQLEKKEITLQQLKETRFKNLLAYYGLENDPTMEDKYEQILSTHHELLDHVHEVLEILSKKYTLVLVSNGMPNIQHPRLKESQIEQYFSHIFISEEIGVQKPDIAFFNTVLNTINASNKECLMIGDSLTSDIQGAKNANIDSCLLTQETKPFNTTYTIHSLEDLLQFL